MLKLLLQTVEVKKGCQTKELLGNAIYWKMEEGQSADDDLSQMSVSHNPSRTGSHLHII